MSTLNRAVPPGTRRSGEGGSGAVLALAAMCVVILCATGALGVASALGAAHQARSAADLAALAGAGALQASAPLDACAAARDLAHRNDAQLVSCRVERGQEVIVETSSTVPLRLPGLSPEAMVGRARAGPHRP